MWGFFLGALPLAITFAERELFGWRLGWGAAAFGWALFGVLGSIGLYCGMLFAVHGRGTPLPLDTATRFLVMGPYRWVRNPMAMTGIGQGFAVGLILDSPAVLWYSLAGALAWHFFARPWEERDLEERFGKPYLDYRAQVQNWLPRVSAYPKVLAEHAEH